MTDTTDIVELAHAALMTAQISQLPDGRTFAFRPTGEGAYALDNITQAHTLAEPLPSYVRTEVVVQTPSSLVEYVNRFKNKDTALFADIKQNAIVAAIDYHHETADKLIGKVVAALTAHRAMLALPFSEEWMTWTKQNDSLMKHIEFASFLEENGDDIVSPPGAELLELCRSLQGTRNVSFGGTVRNGDYEELSYKKDTRDETVTLPVSIQLMLPVYFGDIKVPVTAYIRRTVDNDGKLFLGYRLKRIETVRQDRFHAIVDAITQSTVTLGEGTDDLDTTLMTVYGSITKVL